MTKKTTIKLLIIVFLTILTFVLCMKFIGYRVKEDKGFIGFCGRLLNKTNDFKYTYNNINKSDIDIFWYSEEYSDTLVSKGKIIKKFGYVYGPEKFTVLIDNDTLCSAGFWSTNNNDTYNVEINITKAYVGFIVTYLFESDFDSDKVEVYLDLKGNEIKREYKKL
jgi:hypothetical protein